MQNRQCLANYPDNREGEEGCSSPSQTSYGQCGRLMCRQYRRQSYLTTILIN